MKHTPGPWKVDECEDAHGHYTIRHADGTPNGDTQRQLIATVYYHDKEESVNPELIAAAPDLLEACKARLECDTVFEQGTSEWSQAVHCADAMMQEAIAKAERTE